MTVDAEAFWRLGPLPPQGDGNPGPDPAGTALERLARPDITIDGRNLADVVRPVYSAFTAP